MGRFQLIVSNNQDSGAGSLRAALQKTQQHSSGKFDIVFKSNKKPNNSLTTGFFTIALKSPLPVIYRNDVQINVTSPRSVILVPDQASKSPEASSGLMNSNGPGSVNGSLLYVGDTNYLYKQKEHYKGSNLPNVTINNVSFIRNKAKGGSGSAGSGGGLGTGGAITLLAGDLKVTNSIFQGLTAEGGSGGSPNKGGHGAVFNDLIKKADPKKGASGGQGGVSSIPIRSDSTGNFRYGELAAAGGAGGASGTGNKVCNGNQGSSKHAGKAGQAGASTSVFGMGGGGGGAGGGGAWSFDKKFSCFIVPRMTLHSGGSGAAGGRGGDFAGNGARGGSGGRANGKNIFGQGPSNGGPSSGGTGSNGSSLGEAIANWGDNARRLSGENISATLSLDNVSFYNNSSPGNEIFSDSSLNPIYINNVFVGSGRNDRKQVPTGRFTRLAGNHPFKALPSTDNKPPIFYGLSVPRVESVADVSDTILQASELSDQFYIGVEDRSTVAGITTDLTNEDNPLNKLWKALVPDNSSKILEDYQSKVNQSYESAMITSERGDKILKELAKDAIASSIRAVTKDFIPGGFGASTISTTVVDFAEDHIKYMSEKVMLERNKDEALEENMKLQDELARNLEEQSTAQLSSIQLGLQRSKVIIKDFSLGNDSVTLPKGPNNAPIVFDVAKNRGKTVVLMKYETGSNADLPFLSIELDRQSTNALAANANNASASQYLLSMLVDNADNDKLLLGSNLAQPLAVEGQSFSSGPAGTTLVVDRNASQRSLTDRISLNTSTGRDAIYGSDGLEVVNTGANEDMIFPGIGGDDINGGPGSDLVSYVVRPMSTASPEAMSLVAKSDQSIHVTKKDNTDGMVGKLRNIEDFHLFGDSFVDLRALTGDTTQRSIISGSGSELKGSDGKEVFQISYYSDYNNSVADAYAATTLVNGRGGFDRLIVDTENAPFNVGFIHEGNELVLVRESDDSVLLHASGIESFAGTARALEGEISDFLKITPVLEEEFDVLPGFDGTDFSDGNDQVASQPATSGGTSGNDLLIGTRSRDTLTGLDGDDTLSGGSGNDILEPGTGADVVAGGPGKDTYRLPESDESRNIIVLDTEKDKDKIFGFDPTRDSILFAQIDKINASTKKLKKAKKLGHNVVIKGLKKGKSTLFYRNDESNKFSKLISSGSDLSTLDFNNLLESTELTSIAPDLI